MEYGNIYKDIAKRTGGDIYIGVVGPVRTGKSTFIKQFMDIMVLPNIQGYMYDRAKDELPQSAEGRTIMTTEPKFVPNEGVEITTDDNISFKVRLIDCVGYLVEGAGGHMEEDVPRMVSTPWSEEKLPFAEAAEIGTKKVITEHSTIGVVVTTDGSVTDIERENYIPAEEKVISELKEINKPFVIALNSKAPYSESCTKLSEELKNKYKVPVIPVNAAQLKEKDISHIMQTVLYEFPLARVNINIPRWLETLPYTHELKIGLIETIKEAAKDMTQLEDVKTAAHNIENNENIKKVYVEKIDPGVGEADIDLELKDHLFYNVLSEETGTDIKSDYHLFSAIKELTTAKKNYDKVKNALEQVNSKGYGIVVPDLEEIELEQPKVIKNGSGYGINIAGDAPAIHLIKSNIKTSISPVVGSEQQSEQLAEYLRQQYSEDSMKALEYNIFGKSLGELMNEDLHTKLNHLPEDTQAKLKTTIEKIINEGNGGMICILL